MVDGWAALDEARRKVGDWLGAEAAARERQAAAVRVYGAGHWQATDARLEVDHCRLLARLSPADRKRLDDAESNDEKWGVLFRPGKFGDAIGLVQESLAVRKAVLGATHPATLASLADLAMLYRSQGRYADAEPLYREALAGRRSVLGDAHRDTLTNLTNLGMLYLTLGRHADAEPLLKEALAGRRKALGDAHPNTAKSLSNLAMLYFVQGRYVDAEPLLVEALTRLRKALGDGHPEALIVRNNLATLYHGQGRYADAEPLFREALAGYRKAFGDADLRTLDTMNNLGVSLRARGRHADAEPLLEEAMAGRRKALGNAHPVTIETVGNLAVLYSAQGRYADAEKLHREALAGARKALGDTHPDTARVLSNFARVLWQQRNYPDAAGRAGEAIAVVTDHLERSSVVQSEAAQLANVARERWHIDVYLAASVQADPAATYAAVLRWQGAVTARQTFARAARGVDPAAKDLLGQLERVTREFVNLTNNPPPPDKKIDVPARLKELGEQRADLEAKLAAKSAAFDKYVKNRALAPADLQKALPVGVALVNYIGYDDKLAAFVVRGDGVARVELGAVKPVADAADAFRSSLGRTRPTTGDPGDPAVTLRRLVWEPVAKRLGGASVVLVCPDGPLCRVPFAALPAADPEKYLIEEVAVAVVPVPRLLPELLAGRGPKRNRPPTLLAVGGVDFDAAAAGPQVAAAPAPAGRKWTRAGGPRLWQALDGTAGEVAELAGLFRKAVLGGKLTVLEKGGATEAAVRDELARHEFVHLATHGFFADPDRAAPARGIDPIGAPRPAGPHPGLLSGVALAGANKPSGEDDGVLTALEVGDLDLSRVELAVLSACETGLGAAAGGEGVLGLQRAFQVAGARATVTSLWKVDDDATRRLMGHFYAGYWRGDNGALAALRAAQLAMLAGGPGRSADSPTARAAFPDPTPADARPGRTPPHLWAAFVLSGDWR